MNSLAIYHGAPTPLRLRGKNVCRLVSFAERYPGWHTAASGRATRNALASAVRSGCIEQDGDQFRFVYPKGTQA